MKMVFITNLKYLNFHSNQILPPRGQNIPSTLPGRALTPPCTPQGALPPLSLSKDHIQMNHFLFLTIGSYLVHKPLDFNINRKGITHIMKTQYLTCPSCGTDTLVPTGAFWTCLSCRMAITSQAIKTDLGYFPTIQDSSFRLPHKPLGLLLA